MMDRHGIATGVLSVTAPGVHLGGDGETHALARAVNEYGAEIVKDRPGRFGHFGHFASVPLPDADAAVEEAVHALDDLGADGVVLMSNARGRYLGDPAFEPLWAELDRRGANFFVHPAQPPMELLPGTPAPLAHYIFDTTRTVLNMVHNGVLTRHPNARVIRSHGGGSLPYAAYRHSGLTPIAVDPGRTADDVLRDLKRFYFDTALSAGPSALPALLPLAEPGHVPYGSDSPFAPEETVRPRGDRQLLRPLPGGLSGLRPRSGRRRRPRQRRSALPATRALTCGFPFGSPLLGELPARAVCLSPPRTTRASIDIRYRRP